VKTLWNSLQVAWEFIAHPRRSVEALQASPRAGRHAWTFLLLSVSLWALLTAYVNIFLGSTARGREVVLGISFGPDIIITLLTVPLGVGAIALAAWLFSLIARRFGSSVPFRPTFYTLAFTLNVGSTFFDLPHEIGWAVSTQAPWKLAEFAPGFFYYTAVVMFGSILLSLIVTVVALAHLHRLSVLETLVTFFLSVLPIFGALIFVVM
jgi:hypothetical protein